MQSTDFFFYMMNIKVSNIGEFLGILVINLLPIDGFYNSDVCELKKLIHLCEHFYINVCSKISIVAF